MSRTGLWDSHGHLDDEAFDADREELIAQLEQDLDGIVNPGCDAESSAKAVALQKSIRLSMRRSAIIRKISRGLPTIILSSWQRGRSIRRL